MIRLLPIGSLVVGLAGGYAWPRPEPAPLPEPARVARATAACDLGEMAETLAGLRHRRDAERARYDEVRDALAAVVGAPEPWPEVAEAYAEPTVIDGLSELLGEGFEVQSMDCSEYPCVALVELLGADLPTRVAGQAALRDRIDEAGYAIEAISTTMHTDGERDAWRLSAAFALPDPAVPADDERTRFRVREASELFEER